MNKRLLSWIIMTMLILEAFPSHAFFHSESKVPQLLQKLLENYPAIRKANSLSPEYQDHPPTPISNFRNYDWYYVDPATRLGTLSKRKRSAARHGPRMALCAKTKRGRCIAKCGFGAPLDQISNNRFFGCRRIANSKYLRI